MSKSRRQKCSTCSQEGHNKRTCPMKSFVEQTKREMEVVKKRLEEEEKKCGDLENKLDKAKKYLKKYAVLKYRLTEIAKIATNAIKEFDELE